MVFYCKEGDLLEVDALYEELYVKFFNTVTREPYIEGVKSSNKEKIEIKHGELVIALEGSVPPWYNSDLIRCLYKDNVVFIKRLALKKYEQS